MTATAPAGALRQAACAIAAAARSGSTWKQPVLDGRVDWRPLEVPAWLTYRDGFLAAVVQILHAAELFDVAEGSDDCRNMSAGACETIMRIKRRTRQGIIWPAAISLWADESNHQTLADCCEAADLIDGITAAPTSPGTLDA